MLQLTLFRFGSFFLLPLLFSFYLIISFIVLTEFLLILFSVGSVTIYGWESMIPLGFLAATGYFAGYKSPFLIDFFFLSTKRTVINLNLSLF